MGLIDKLTAIADAIRGKTGTTGTMTLDEMVTYIASIEVGSTGGYKFSSGEITFNSDYYVSSSSGGGTEISHNLGVVPDAIFIRSDKSSSSVIYLETYFGTKKNGIFNPDGKLIASYHATGISQGNVSVASVNSSDDFTSSSGTCVRSANTTSFYFAPPSNMMAKSGTKYMWYAIGKI